MPKINKSNIKSKMHTNLISFIALLQGCRCLKVLTQQNLNCFVMWCAFFISLFLNSCNEADDYPIDTPEKQAISWSLEASRALVNNDLLQSSCTPNVNGDYQSIGVWGSYTTSENGTANTYSIFDATPLIYAQKGEHTNPYNDWNYPGEARFWMTQAQYNFRACYPQALMTSLMTQIDATMLQGGPINTQDLQEDMLVAATHIDIQDEVPSGPVVLNMKHIFAALRFKVKAAQGYTPPSEEKITSCWLQNNGTSTELFSPSGYLVHSGNENPEITWYPYESPSVPMYKWSHNGISIATETLLYGADGVTEGDVYTKNDGWILVVPQQVKQGTLQFCYTMNSAGSHVFSVDIPAVKYEDGMRYTYVLEIGGADATGSLTLADWNCFDAVYDIIM